jgi:hypothetical protein
MAQVPRPTPLDLVESYFDVELNKSGLKKLDRKPNEVWVDFSKVYLATMQTAFVPEFLDVPDGDHSVRLFFEPRMAGEWAKAVGQMYRPSPLLGVETLPDPTPGTGQTDGSAVLAPLMKHLLVADSVFVRDSFYKCFDTMAEVVPRGGWGDDVHNARIVEDSIHRIKVWLPILAQLRPLIESRALVFMPYFATPSFPYGADSPDLEEPLKRLRVRDAEWWVPPKVGHVDFASFMDEPDLAQIAAKRVDPVEERRMVDTNAVIGAWLNARMLGLDPVFPNRAMFDVASGFYFAGERSARDLTSDLISMDILPFGRADGISLKDLLKIRKNEEVFAHVREATGACKNYLNNNIPEGATRDALTKTSREFLKDQLAGYERKSVVRFVDEHPVAGMAYTFAFGVAFLPAGALIPPAIPLIAAAVLTPQIALLARRRFSRKSRAISLLLALL